MATITEDYVSFEITKLLKEKGFDETCYACYEYFSSSITMYSGWPFEYKGEPIDNADNRIKCPTLQMAMKWLREKDIHILFEITKIQKNPKYYCVIWNTSTVESYIIDLFNSYEEAAEEAIKYSLKYLI